MPKSRKRKPKKPPPPPPHPPSQPPTEKGPLRQIWDRWWGKCLALYTAFATFAAVAAGIDFFHEMTLATIPEVHEQVSDEISPFAAPFLVRNGSSLFSATEVLMRCNVDYITTEKEISFRGGSVMSAESVDIPPAGVANMRCPVGRENDGQRNALNIPGDDRITTAHVFIDIQYRTLGMMRHTDRVEFTWFATPTHHFWVRGKITGV